VTGLTIGEIMNDPDLSAISGQCAAEAYAVARAKGIRLGLDDPVAYVRDFGSKIPNARPSVLLDLMAGRRSEIGVINGAIPRVAAELGLDAPVNRTITALVLARERQLGCR
jgi:2-dehydropantoate 2-reductase